MSYTEGKFVTADPEVLEKNRAWRRARNARKWAVKVGRYAVVPPSPAAVAREVGWAALSDRTAARRVATKAGVPWKAVLWRLKSARRTAGLIAKGVTP